jgi:hypothetical protein
MSNEYKYNLVSDSLYYPRVLVFSDNTTNHMGYGSLYAVTEETVEAIKREGTVSGYSGAVWSKRVWLDIDSYEEADKVEQKLQEMGYDYIAYDSGGKGAHFGILRDHPPSHLLPKKDRAWVREHFPQADSSIYTSLHLFRLPGTVHEKTGRRKEIVKEQKGTQLILPNLDLSRGRSTASYTQSSVESIFKDGRVLQNIKQARVGDRHFTLVKVAYALKDKEVDPTIAQWFLQEVNKGFSEPKEVEQVDKILKGIYEKV